MAYVNLKQLISSRDTVNNWMERFGVRFGVYKKGVFNEQLFPFDSIPRVIPKKDWDYLEAGLKQRVKALNLFLWDIYHEKRIIKEGVIPPEFVYSSKGYMPECEGVSPVNGVYAHIAGIDLVEGKNGEWYVLEDNLRIPSGASYPMIARKLCRKVSPSTFAYNTVADNRDYSSLLKEMMDSMCVDGGIKVILTPGRYNSAFFEHSYLAEHTDSVLVQNDELFVENNILYHRTYSGGKTKIGVLYRTMTKKTSP